MTDLQVELINWYQKNKRDLPWRNTKDPYFVWLSEIILQQTRVDQGLPYYMKFVKNFPSVNELALASEKDVLNNWQGLGYYSRARNLHETSKKIVNEFCGLFPNSFEEIVKLKGIGKYTAAAIASFCFDEPVAVVDGNVYRVLSRVFDIELPINVSKNHRVFETLANELLYKKNPAIFNQAIMEFGAMLCKPSNPKCSVCPIRIHCLSYKNKTIQQRPVKQKLQKIKNRYFIYWVVELEGKLLLRQRQANDIWKKLYEFPCTEVYSNAQLQKLVLDHGQVESMTFNHVLSHQRILARFIKFSNLKEFEDANNEWVSHDDLPGYPLHRLMTKYFDSLFH
jgi:A/G-specific adenine glycosylase